MHPHLPVSAWGRIPDGSNGQAPAILHLAKDVSKHNDHNISSYKEITMWHSVTHAKHSLVSFTSLPATATQLHQLQYTPGYHACGSLSSIKLAKSCQWHFAQCCFCLLLSSSSSSSSQGKSQQVSSATEVQEAMWALRVVERSCRCTGCHDALAHLLAPRSMKGGDV